MKKKTWLDVVVVELLNWLVTARCFVDDDITAADFSIVISSGTVDVDVVVS